MNRVTRTFGPLLAAVLLVVGTAGLVTPGVVAAETTLKVVVHADLKILDPVWTTMYITQRYGYVVYDTLFAFDSKFEPKPQMVDKYTVSDDGLTYTFTLRPGLKFSDGQAVTTRDVIASLARWMKRDPMGQRLNGFLRSMEAVNASTFRLVLRERYGLVLDTLGKPTPAPFIMPERVATTDPMTQITDYTGSGPFMLVKDEWKPGHKVVFRKNPYYVPRKEAPDYLAGGKIAKVDRIEWLYIPDNNTTLSALTAGEIDYFEAPPLDFVPVIEKNPKLKLMTIDRLGVQTLLRPNHLLPPFNNVKARQALLYLVNQEDYMRAVVGNPAYYTKFCGAFFMCASDNATDAGSEPLKHQNVEKARQLLKEAGYNGERVVVLQPTDRPQYNAATMVTIQMLRKAGVNVDAQAADWSTIAGRRAKKEPITEGGWNIFHTTQGGPEAASPVGNVWFNTKCERANPGWPCDLELDKLVQAWSREPDRAKRKPIVEQIQKRAYETVPYVPVGEFNQPIAFRASLQGVLAAGFPVYWNIEKK